MNLRGVCSVWVTLGAAVFAPADILMSDPAPDQLQGSDNPHWQTDRCHVCHGSGTPRSIPIAQTDALCLDCHDGVRASAESHPIARTVHSTDISIPIGWPLVDDRLACLTCHDAVLACKAAERPPARNSNFLRDGSVNALNAFCAKCHNADAFAQFNPHTASVNTAARSRCDHCHSDPNIPSDAATADARSDSRLVADELTLCGACHRSHLDYFVPGHLHVSVDQPMLQWLQAAPSTDPRADRRIDITPLGENMTITCSTCHNPHAVGVFPDAAFMAIGAIDANKSTGQTALRLPMKDLCANCHGP